MGRPNSEDHYRIQRNQPVDPTLTKLNSIHTIAPTFCKINLYKTLPFIHILSGYFAAKTIHVYLIYLSILCSKEH